MRGSPFSERKALDRAIIIGDVAPPMDYVRAELCRTFHCLPSELDAEDSELLKLAALLAHADEVRAKEAKRRYGKR